MARVLRCIGRIIVRYLEKPVRSYKNFTPSDPAALLQLLEPGDVLLVEGNSRFSGAIKYLTQSIWSHAALYVGPIQGANTRDDEPHVLIEAEVAEGVVSSPLSKYRWYRTRFPSGQIESGGPRGRLQLRDRANGVDYDFRNLIDLLRVIIPLRVPQRWRRRILPWVRAIPPASFVPR